MAARNNQRSAPTSASQRTSQRTSRDESPARDAEAEPESSEDDAAPEAELLDDGPTLVEPAPDEVPDDEPHGKELAPYVPRDPVQRFLSEARRFPRLSEEDERALIAAVRDRGDRDAARRLVVHNLRLVVSIAYQYRQAWTSILDLFQEGSVGLMEAVKRWDPALGTRFGSYAAYWIRAFILKFLMTNARLIHVGNTRAGRKLFFRLEKERQKLLAAGFDPTPKLLAAKLDVDEKDIEEVSAHLSSREVSLEPRPDEEGISLEERISGQAVSPESAAARSELSENLGVIMRRFDESLTDERERAIWREHLAAEEPLPLGALGERFGVTKQRMGQIADKVKKRFREAVLTEMGTDIELAWQPATDE
jgi:RNA polymerase sigma-32 factor